MIDRFVHPFANHKKHMYLLLSFLVYRWFSLFLFLIFQICFWSYQRIMYCRAVRRYRERKETFIVYGPADDPLAKEIADEMAKGKENVSVISTFNFDPWHMVAETVNVCFVLGDSINEDDDALFSWIRTEKATRLEVSLSKGWLDNIVYTEEGSRRNGFHRTNYCVVGSGRVAKNLDVYMENFGARRVDDVFLHSVESDPNDMPGIMATMEWAFGCPCCAQFAVEKHRNRPSNLRIGTLQMLLAGLYGESTALSQLKRAALFLLTQYVPFPLKGSVVGVLPTQSHLPPPLPPMPMFQCVWGDDELTDKDGFDSAKDKFEKVDQWVVNDTFQMVSRLGASEPSDWEYEYAAYFNGQHIMVKHDQSPVVATFAIENKDQSLFNDLVPGAPFYKDSELIVDNPKMLWWLLESKLIVPKEKRETEPQVLHKMQQELRENGWTLLQDMRELIPRPFWNAVRRYYKLLRPWLTTNAPGKTWNDEPVARHLNCALTKWMEEIANLPLVQSALTLSIFVQPGQEGFLYHTDTSPPFDITLDFVIDHEGSGTRPLYFCRQNPNGNFVPKVEKLELNVGQAVIFRGAEMTHWGGDLQKDTMHSVILLTWQICQD